METTINKKAKNVYFLPDFEMVDVLVEQNVLQSGSGTTDGGSSWDMGKEVW